MLDKPTLDALAVVDVIAIEHAADRIVLDCLQTDRALRGEEVARVQAH